VADAIAADVASGRLAPGDQLPTQRALARHLGITTGTVNRGYAIAERAGVVTAEVGRGTFVTLADTTTQSTGLVSRASGAIDMGLNYLAGQEAEQALGRLLPRLAKKGFAGLLGLSPYEGQPRHRAAGARWLRYLGVSAGEEQVLLCASVQHGLAATLAALTVPGDVVLTESLTSPGIKALAAMHHLRLVAVESDGKGILPEALAEACRTSKARALYTMPTLHTPTTATMPEARRRAIAEVLRRQSLIAIEDDAWGFLAAGSVTPLHTFAPENVVYVTSFSKSLAPGIRVGYIVAPQPLQRGIASCIGTMTWTSPLLAEVVTQWIDDGTAESIAKQRTQAAGRRLQLAARVLGRSFARPATPSYHLWLPLSEPWRADDFVNHAATLGVSLAPTDMFVPGRASTPHAIRVCLGTEPDLHRLEEGLSTLARMLRSGPSGYSAFRV
jgi:DNA-binding transcriptional MocR family regulator